MVLNYNGVLYSYYVGGELKRPGRTYIYASVISIVLLIVVWVGVWLLMLNTVGLDFMQSQAKLGATDPAAYGAITSLQSSAGGLGYGLVLSGDPISKILIGIAVPSARAGGRPRFRRRHHARPVRACLRPAAAHRPCQDQRAQRRADQRDHRRGGGRHRLRDAGGLPQPRQHRRQPGSVRRPDHPRRRCCGDRPAVPAAGPDPQARRDGAAANRRHPGAGAVGRSHVGAGADRGHPDHRPPGGLRRLHRVVGRHPGARPRRRARSST